MGFPSYTETLPPHAIPSSLEDPGVGVRSNPSDNGLPLLTTQGPLQLIAAATFGSGAGWGPHSNVKCTTSFQKDFVGCAIAAILS